ncbi:MAG: hypothetical protein C5B52_15820 [Bacteroidetes bacterium]|nr:MAG: hypothetical protein C5B52_15820 [Bacteroidota bacterium]
MMMFLRFKFYVLLSISLLFALQLSALTGDSVISVNSINFSFKWKINSDEATLKTIVGNSTVWQGGLLPAFWLQWRNDQKQYLKPEVDLKKSKLGASNGYLALSFAEKGEGLLSYTILTSGLSFDSLYVHWFSEIPAIIDLYFGTSRLTEKQRSVVSSLELPFWPNWQSDGFCIPTAKSSPLLSFFNSSSFGNANFSLGSFGTSSTLYAAAYPRPLYAAAIGNNNGWLVAGAGAIPAGAMYLQAKSSCGAIRYCYREDLWGGETKSRVWEKPLVLQWDSTAWDAYADLFSVLDFNGTVQASHQKSHWNSWGDFSKGDFNVKSIADGAKQFGAEEVTLDMGWETSQSTAIPDLKHIPDFDKDIAYIKQQGLELGFWQSLIWVADTLSTGLTTDDLLIGEDGRPRRNNNFHNPFWADWSFYCIDPTSKRAQNFLKERTQNIIKRTGAKLLKLDFGYAIPPLDVAAPRNPAFRGENYAYTLIRIISDAAREMDPGITIQYYGISPLLKRVYNLIALDDLADASGDEPGGHAQWSIWSSLAGMNGSAIMASSGYDWFTDAEILLNTAIIGSPGTVLKRTLPDGSAIPKNFIAHRKALNLWYRKTTGWKPLWLNSAKGKLGSEPVLNCWGRLETHNGIENLTALSLRETGERKGIPLLEKTKWKGRWSILSQDSLNIFSSRKLAVIPFDGGYLSIQRVRKPVSVKAIFLNDRQAVFTNWNWSKGIFTIYSPRNKEFETLMGFIVE